MKSPDTKKYKQAVKHLTRGTFITKCIHNRKRASLNTVGAIHELSENKFAQYGKCAKHIIKMLPDGFIEICGDNGKRAIRESPLQSRCCVVVEATMVNRPYKTVVVLSVRLQW